MSPARERAVVVGAGTAGLLAAAALAGGGLEVVVVDRGELPTEDGSESGHTGLQPLVVGAEGARALEALLPGVTAELLARGATSGRARVVETVDGESRRSAGHALATTRGALETTLRRLVGARLGVSLRECTTVVDVVVTGSRAPYGVVVCSPDHLADLRTVHADVVVDASGQASRLSSWLSHNGFGPVIEDRTRLDAVWTTHFFAGRRPHDAAGREVVALTVRRSVSVPRAGRVVAAGAGCAVTLVGYDGERPPCDPSELADYAGRLASTDVAEVLGSLTHVPTDSVTTRASATVRRRYDVAALPERLAVVGDARRTLDPLVGDGVARAAREAVALGGALETGVAQLTARYLTAVSTT